MNPEAYLEMAETETHHWWFAGRRSIMAFLISKFDLPPGAKILEIGSGTGGNLQMLSAFGQVSALEMDATARLISVEKTLGCFDIRAGHCPENIPFSGKKFNLICLFDVLEHIEEDVATLAAAKELLAQGGRMIITVPAYRWMWSAHDEFLHHKRRYSALELREKIAAAGLRVEKMSYFNTLFFPLIAFFLLMDRLLGTTFLSGAWTPPRLINGTLRRLFGAERFLLENLNLPFGVSLLAILRAEPDLILPHDLMKRIRRFAVSGVMITGLHALIAVSLIRLIQSPPPLANGIAFVGATIFSYVINTHWSFSSSLNRKTLRRFLIVSIVGFFLAVAISGLVEFYGMHYWFGIAGVICVVTPVNFLLHSFWTYK